MADPIEEGTILGGRYRVTGLVASSDDQDLVLTGTDTILNRHVSILVAADPNASNVAESARQIAIGERSSAVQVLDLGLSEGRTYLIASEIGPDELLELATPAQAAPYVEPFYTDTLGSEIFGESRQYEPEVYEDDEEYYGTLQADYDDGAKPSLLDRFANRISARRNARAAGAGAVAHEALGPQTEEQARIDAPVEPAVDPTAEPEVETEIEAEEPTEFLPPPPQQPPSTPEPFVEPTAVADDHPPVTAPVATTTTGATAPVAVQQATAGQDQVQSGQDPAQQGSNKTRILVVIMVALSVIIGAVFALNALNNQSDPPVASDPSTDASASASESAEPTQTTSPTVAPVAVGVTRVVPDSPGLNEEYDDALPQIIDGNNATSWDSYTFESANFGGFAGNMALVVELEEVSDISEIVISQSGGSGGAVEVLISDTPDLEQARRITTTSFTGPEMSVSVSEEGQPAKAQYVIVNVTELPNLQGGNRPYGMRIAEIEVS